MFGPTKFVAVAGALLGLARADNPIIQTLFSTDPAPYVWNNTVWLFTGHDENGARNYDMRDWRLYSSTDMVNWRDWGVMMSLRTFSWAKADAWAAQVIERDGKFYYYVTATKNSGGYAVGVGVSDHINGPYKDALGRQLLSNNGIDPTVFIDDTDGQAYMYWGHNGPAYYVKLNRDMISYSGSIQSTSVANFVEGPWLMKRNSTWYMVYSSFDGGNEDIKYATSNRPTGPWTSRGQIMAPKGRSFTNHAGIIDYKGGSYFFYHNGALPGGGTYSRSVCVEKFSYNADGSIPKLQMTDEGAPQIGALNPYQQVEAETIAFSTGLSTAAKSDGTGIYVTSISNGDYIKVKGVDFGTAGPASVDLRLAAASGGGRLEIRVGNLNSGTVLATCNVDATGGAQTWKTVSCPVTGATTGKQDLFFKFSGNYNFDWWQFKEKTA